MDKEQNNGARGGFQTNGADGTEFPSLQTNRPSGKSRLGSLVSKVGTATFLLAAAVYATAILHVTAASSELSFSASGTSQYDVFENGTNNVILRVDVRFRMDVDSCRWAITSWAVPDNGHGTELTYDGTYTYSTIAGPTLAAQIKKDDVPFSLGTRAECVWLALASGCYLRREDPGFISSAWIHDDGTEASLRGSRYRAQVLQFLGNSHLPRLLECYADGNLAARYECIATTNISGFDIPLQSDVRFFQPKGSVTKTADGDEVMRVQIIVEEISTPCVRDKWQPALGSRARISDYRFVGRPAVETCITYNTGGASWPKETDESVQQARRVAKNMKSAELQDTTVDKRLVRFCVGGAMLLVTVAVLALLLKRLRQPRKLDRLD